MPAARFAIALAVLIPLPPLHAAPLFQDHEVVDAVLEGPIGVLLEDADSHDQLPFAFRADGTEHTVKVRLRGKSRLRVCDFLPLRLNFRKGDVAGTLLEGQDKLKLVVPCHTSERAEKDLIEEYAVYRMLNLLTPASYRVRLLRMTFRDTASDGEEASLHAFLLESERELVERLGGEKAQLAEVALSWFDPGQMALVYVFQYLVSNVDWSLVREDGEKDCCHNGTLIRSAADLYYVPYDFDLSGFVNAPYAFPPPELRLRSVTQRRYRGFCTDREHLQQALRTIMAERPEFVTLIRSLPVLSDKDKERRIGYLEPFFRAADDENRLLDRFERSCLD
jgi:hypothetical protein